MNKFEILQTLYELTEFARALGIKCYAVDVIQRDDGSYGLQIRHYDKSSEMRYGILREYVDMLSLVEELSAASESTDSIIHELIGVYKKNLDNSGDD